MNQYELGDALAVPFFMEMADRIKEYEGHTIIGYEMNDIQKLAFMTTFRRVLVSLLFSCVVKGITSGIKDASNTEDRTAQLLITALMEDIQKNIKKLYPNIDFVVAVRAKEQERQIPGPDGEL